MKLFLFTYLSISSLINIIGINASAIEDYKTKLLKDVNNVMNELKDNNNESEKCENIYLQIHQCPLSVQALISYDDICDNLNKCKEIFKDVDSLKNTLADCDISDEENQLIFENYHNITDNVAQHIEAFCYFDEEGHLCPLSKRIREDDELTNIMAVDNNFDFQNYINNIKLYPKHRIKNLDILKENCFSEKCLQASLNFIENSWNEIQYLTLEEYNLKTKQINILSSEECNSEKQLKQSESQLRELLNQQSFLQEIDQLNKQTEFQKPKKNENNDKEMDQEQDRVLEQDDKEKDQEKDQIMKQDDKEKDQEKDQIMKQDDKEKDQEKDQIMKQDDKEKDQEKDQVIEQDDKEKDQIMEQDDKEDKEDKEDNLEQKLLNMMEEELYGLEQEQLKYIQEQLEKELELLKKQKEQYEQDLKKIEKEQEQLKQIKENEY
ncbi:hypothetical protein PIROE2DRAFT_57395 [Piromyces sp. E2]|nr:hypothetical protein PIROE2DRAFT_57395 [Piromyces sp. E2]|eukprot:OUM69506.1 hypothetical protein PIROE2DRAFT_57395 [Piromyces sp. E2]